MSDIVLFPFTRHPTIDHFLGNALEISEHYNVLFSQAYTDEMYDDLLRLVWNHDGDIVILEHDIHANHNDIKNLLDCNYPLCARAYRLSHTDYTDVIVHRKFGQERPDWASWLSESEEWADYAGFGLTKIGKLFRKAYPPYWPDYLPDEFQKQRKALSLDSRFSLYTHEQGIQFHIHWPTIHHSKEVG